MNITIKDVEDYIKELEIQKQILKDNEPDSLFIDWLDKQIIIFKNKLNEVIVSNSKYEKER